MKSWTSSFPKGRSFIKMQGLRNHFVIVDGRAQPFAPDAGEIIRICDPCSGVGGEQLLVIEPPSTTSGAYARVRIYNPDGKEVEACGNATRCVAKLLFDESGRCELGLEIHHSVLWCERAAELISVEMAKVSMDWQKIPLAQACDTLHVDISDNGVCDGVAVNVGNPHLVYFVDDFAAVDLADVGTRIQANALLPESANIGLAEVIDDQHIKFQVYERPGVITQACGSGSCAVVLAAYKRGLIPRPSANVQMPGGSLHIHYKENHLPVMTGPAEYCYSGYLPVYHSLEK